MLTIICKDIFHFNNNAKFILVETVILLVN